MHQIYLLRKLVKAIKKYSQMGPTGLYSIILNTVQLIAVQHLTLLSCSPKQKPNREIKSSKMI